MTLSRLRVALVASVALGSTACPYDGLSRSLGLAIGGSGGGSGGPHVLLILQQPFTGTAGNILTPALLVEAADSLGRADTGFTGTINTALSTNPAGANLTGARSVAAVRGIASFGDLAISKASSGYVLQATAQGSSSVSTAPITITP